MTSAIAIFDIGKTNKKFLLFNEGLEIVHEVQTNFEEIEDEEGEKCEDLNVLTHWMLDTWSNAEKDSRFNIIALNFATYGASFVHLDIHGLPITPLYNYMKKFPEEISSKFYSTYGDKLDIATDTASPSLGMLNSGLQIFWLKYKHPVIFKKIKTSLHFPQYCSWLFSKHLCTEYTSIGCHTALWNPAKNDYHSWVYAENLDKLFPPISQTYENGFTSFRGFQIPVGTGLHDSSAALIPYLDKFNEEFLLLSTGTWCVTLNPFAKSQLTRSELISECLTYMTFEGKQVKASRVFLGNDHEHWTKRFASHFYKAKDYYKTINFDPTTYDQSLPKPILIPNFYKPEITVTNPDIDQFETYEQAYHKLVTDMVTLQTQSILLAAEGQVDGKTLFVDGGFSKNLIFMKLLQQSLPSLKLETLEISQGTSKGAALVMK